MANMAERLYEKKPVRKDLYSFARMVMWLPQYQDSDLETIVADLKDIFSRWPWYDEQVTDYQIRYEFSNTIGGDTPLPMNCDNDDMQRYCIGKEQCPYSIWGSLPSLMRCTIGWMRPGLREKSSSFEHRYSRLE